MFCRKCNTELEDCTCPDLEKRMRRVTDPGGHVAARWCARCDHHYARCRCEAPVWRLRADGQLVDHPALAPFRPRCQLTPT